MELVCFSNFTRMNYLVRGNWASPNELSEAFCNLYDHAIGGGAAR